MTAKGRLFLDSDVVADLSGLNAFPEKNRHEALNVLLGLRDMLALMETPGQLTAWLLVLPRRISRENVLQAIRDWGIPPCKPMKLGEVSADVSLMPGGEDRLDIRKILVERRAPDSSF